MNEVINTILNRASLRKYDDKPVLKEELDAILNAAMRAPTAGNMMLYSILVVEDEEKKKKLSKTCDNQPFIAEAPVVLIFLADMQRWFDFYHYSGVKEYCEDHGLEYRGPEESDLLLASSDAIIAAQNAVIAAESLNIGSCYIGDIMEKYEVHKEMFNLPELVFPIAMLCLGHYPADKKKVLTPRFDEKYIVFRNTYRSLTGEDFSDMFMEREKRISKDNMYSANNLGQFMYARKTGADFSKEMARSVKVALKNWNGKSYK